MDDNTVCPVSASTLVGRASRIETEEGHLMQRSGSHWHAYPKVDPDAPGGGGEVIYTDESRRHLKQFASALDAYAACVTARERHAQLAGAGRGDTADPQPGISSPST